MSVLQKIQAKLKRRPSSSSSPSLQKRKRQEIAIALFECIGEKDEGEISFKVGNKIAVLSKDTEWWEGEVLDGPHKGEKGEFPSNYVKLCEDEPEVKGKNRKRKRKGEEGGQSSEDRGDEYVVALFACEAEEEEEVSFKEGDVLKILSKQGEWWEGEVLGGEFKGKKGILPSNYVRVMSEEEKKEFCSFAQREMKEEPKKETEDTKMEEEEEEPEGNWWENMQEEEEDEGPQRKKRRHGGDEDESDEEMEKEKHLERQKERARRRKEEEEEKERKRKEEEERRREEEEERKREEEEEREKQKRRMEREKEREREKEKERIAKEEERQRELERQRKIEEERERELQKEREKAMKPPPPKEEVTALFSRLKPHMQNEKRFPKAVDAVQKIISDGSILKTPHAISLFLDILCAAGEHIEAKKMIQEENFRNMVKKLFVASQVAYHQMDPDQMKKFDALLLRSKTAFELFSDDSFAWANPTIQIKQMIDDLEKISCPETKKIGSKSVMICLEIAFAHYRKPSIKPCAISLLKHAHGTSQLNSLLDHAKIAQMLGVLEGTGKGGLGMRGGKERGQTSFEKKSSEWGGAAVSKRGNL